MDDGDEQLRCPRFLSVFIVYTKPGEWISAPQLAARVLPMASSEFAAEVARKLSNLNRFGHLERRAPSGFHSNEYRLVPGARRLIPPPIRSVFQIETPVVEMSEVSYKGIDPIP